MARTNLTDSILISRQPGAVVRTGVIVQQGNVENQVQVRVGVSVITAGYLTNSYVPVEGDLVAIIKQDSSWLVLGRLPSVDNPYPSAIIQTGQVTVIQGAILDQWQVQAAVFPVAFPGTPIVTATPYSAITVGTTANLQFTVSNQSATGFEARVRRSTNNNTIVNWVAIYQG